MHDYQNLRQPINLAISCIFCWTGALKHSLGELFCHQRTDPRNRPLNVEHKLSWITALEGRDFAFVDVFRKLRDCSNCALQKGEVW